jgi:hypothetical protein
MTWLSYKAIAIDKLGLKPYRQALAVIRQGAYPYKAMQA